jgi:uncharacterized protein YecA (UPF0149 family)
MNAKLDTLAPKGKVTKVSVAAAIDAVTIGRNGSCPCGSGKKYKKCCGAHA